MIDIDFTSHDIWYGFRRHKFEFRGRNAWIVEPQTPRPGNPWTWCLEWPEAFVQRVGVVDLLKQGFHHVHISAKGYGCDEDIAVFHQFHEYLRSLEFAMKPGLIGMSFGGLYAMRYAAAYPEEVACLYLDAPVCNFHNFRYVDLVVEHYHIKPGENLQQMPGMPVNQTEKFAGIPMLLIYGEDDLVVDPKLNCELMIQRLKLNGGEPVVHKRPAWGHHPHGLDNTSFIVDFMIKYATAFTDA